MNVRTLMVGAHPDDIELGCGGTIAKHLHLKDEIYVIVLTKGESGGHSENMQECLNSFSKLGIDSSNVFFGDFGDGYLSDNLEVVSFIEKIINKYNINRVYTHDSNDRHQDHRSCSRAVAAAARKVPQILFFQGPSTLVTFEPHYFIELSEDDINKKIDALSSYKTQVKKRIVNLDWIKSLACVNGSMCNTRYAEAFSVNHIIEEGENV